MRWQGLTRLLHCLDDGAVVEQHDADLGDPVLRRRPAGRLEIDARDRPTQHGRSERGRPGAGHAAGRGQSVAVAVQRHDRAIELGAPVAEDSPGVTLGTDGVQVERRRDHGLRRAIRLDQFLSRGSGDERRPIERHLVLLAALDTDAIRRDERHHVRGGMSLHAALPVIARVDAGVVRLRADGGRIEQHVCAHQRHAARRLRKPLVPADADAERAVTGLPDAKARVAGREVVLLVVAGTLRDVRLAVDAEHAAVRVDHRQRIEVGVVRPLEDAERQRHLEFARQRLEPLHDRAACDRPRQVEVAREVVLAEVRGFKKFLQKNDLRALASGLAHQRARPGRGSAPRSWSRRTGSRQASFSCFHLGQAGTGQGRATESNGRPAVGNWWLH